MTVMTTYSPPLRPTTYPFTDPWGSGSLHIPTTTPITPGISSGGTLTGISARTILGGLVVNKEYELSQIVDKGYWIKATGSRVTKSGWTNESDWDYVIFDPDLKLEGELLNGSWELGGSGVAEAESFRCFSSLKKGNLNFLLVNKEDQWKKWIIATNMLKMMDPKTKEERVKLFDTVFGTTPDSKAMEF